MRIIFIEGIPGTGKTTLAEKLCAKAVGLGIDAKWYLEESHDHPVHPKSSRTLKEQDNFATECIQSWRHFVEQWESQDTLHILEGSAFQSTVRFMMEKRLSGIEDYYDQFENVVGRLEPRMVYLRPSDPITHSEFVCALRGDEWSTKVFMYLARTDYCVHHKLSGLEGMHRFWDDYANVCDKLVERSAMPTRTIRFAPGEWEKHLTEATAFAGLPDSGNAFGE